MAVLVRNGCKSYNGTPVLDNINLTVDKGSIYGLLGASGCGKTTLLSCMVSLKRLDSGSISVFDSDPSESLRGLGFMPQENTSLHPIFTIRETFSFFGRLYGMEKEGIDKRIEFLAQFLQLPDLSKMIMTLSGGQLRRVSLGVAMIHEPRLLILDEPTVGLDPLVRQSIWKHLLDITSLTKTTIILTTHYTEEAYNCSTVGIMRKGRLVAEENPQTLLSLHKSTSLEKTLLQLCRQDEESLNNNCGLEIKVNNELDQIKIPPSQPIRPSKKSSFICRHDATIISSLMYKSMLLQRRHILMILMQLMLPLMQIILYNTIVGTDPKELKVGFVSQEWNSIKEEDSSLSEYCNTQEMNRTCLKTGMNTVCGFINQFSNNEVEWFPKGIEKDALSSVQAGDSTGYIFLPTNFSRHLQNRLLLRNNADNETIDGSTIKIRLDMSNAIGSLWLIRKILENYLGFMTATVESCDLDKRNVELPLKYNPIYGDLEDSGWNHFIQPGLIIMLTFVLSNVPGGIYVIEKRLGIADRWTVAGVKFGHYIVSCILSESLIIFGQIASLFFVLPYFYGMSIKGSWVLAIAITYSNALGGLGCGLLLGTLAEHEMEVLITLMLINSLNLISCGALWPLEAVRPLFRIFCRMMPSSLAIESLRSIVFRGWGLEHFAVWKGFLSSWSYAIVCIAICLWVHRRRKL